MVAGLVLGHGDPPRATGGAGRHLVEELLSGRALSPAGRLEAGRLLLARGQVAVDHQLRIGLGLATQLGDRVVVGHHGAVAGDRQAPAELVGALRQNRCGQLDLGEGARGRQGLQVRVV
ncbi:MAG TPA: hypothetical protein VIU11_21120, partial [Nakamurella sp.]